MHNSYPIGISCFRSYWCDLVLHWTAGNENVHINKLIDAILKEKNYGISVSDYIESALLVICSVRGCSHKVSLHLKMRGAVQYAWS